MTINQKPYRTVWFENDELCLINQPLLPHKFEIARYRDYRKVAEAITSMVVRGAPAIGATGAYAMALAMREGVDPEKAARVLGAARPTAQDLFYGIDRIVKAAKQGRDPLEEAELTAREYVASSERIGEFGAELIKNGMRLNTHCNAGWLATVDWGTALAPIYKAVRQNKKLFVYVDETRPRCQGSRLTAFELREEKIPHAVIADNAAGYYMARGEIDMVIVGSDRIAVNGDIANKIGTYTSALAAKANNIPFYVAAPLATVDRECDRGADIPIEERDQNEVASMFGISLSTGKPDSVRIAPQGSSCLNPAFDVTPAELITGIITEKGILNPGDLKDFLKREDCQ
jgi:methylthioribose-1-phosphate isomerase